MRVESVKLILDICAEAGRLEQFLPPRPESITARSVRVIEQIALQSQGDKPVRVSDVSDGLDVTRPGITAVLRDLNDMGYVTKTRDEADSRVVYVALTEKGRALYHHYVEEYHTHLTEVLSEIGDEGAEMLARLIRRATELIAQDTANRNA